MFIKYIKSVLWSVPKRLSYIEDACCLKVNSCVSNICRLGITFFQANVHSDVITGSIKVVTAYRIAYVIQFAKHVMNDMEVIKAQQARIMH